MAELKGFMVYLPHQEQIEMLSDQEAGILFKALFDYVASGKVAEMSPLPKMLFSIIKQDIDRDAEKFANISEKRSEAGKKGLEKRWHKEKVIANANFVIANDSKPSQTITNIANINTNTNTNTNSNIKYINEIVEKFNDICTSLPKVLKITDARKTAIKQRLADNSIEDIETVFRKAQASDFLAGRSKDWQATFDWLMKPSNFVKVLEGNYDNAKSTTVEFDALEDYGNFVPVFGGVGNG